MKPKKIAIVFPGQGSQSIGMLSNLAQTFSEVGTTFAQTSECLGYDLWRLTQQGPEEKLNQTLYTQPALLTASVAIWYIWQKHRGLQPTFFAGHSLGEYVALVCAQAITLMDAVKLVAKRGEFMQAAVPEGQGAMAAIVGLTDQQVQIVCEQAAQGEIVAAANFNAQGQVVIAGYKTAVIRAIELAKPQGAKLAKLLPVSVPSHCALMKSAAEKFAKELAVINLQEPKIPIINNVDVAINTQSERIKNALERQLYHPVRWVETIQYLAKQGVELILEFGPGKVLAGLHKRIEPVITTISVNDPESLQQALVAVE